MNINVIMIIECHKIVYIIVAANKNSVGKSKIGITRATYILTIGKVGIKII
jgi:hypothetical protein